MAISIVEKIHEKIAKIIESAINLCESFGGLPEFEMPEISLENPKDKAHGDFACNIGMLLAKSLKMSPRKIAEILVSKMEKGDIIEKIEVAGPGFINFYVKNNPTYEVLKLIEDENYGKIDIGRGKRVVVEFVSANPTGPIHLGNARGGAIGDAISSILEFAGYDVTREFYVNDAGNQVKNLALSLEARYLELVNGEESVEFPENGYHGDDVIEHAKNFLTEFGEIYANCDPELRQKKFEEYTTVAIEKNIEKFKEALAKYRVHYDVWFKESELHKNLEVKKMIKRLVDMGYTYEKDGATWLRSTAVGAEQDEVLVRSNGIPTYLAPDIAYHKNKLVDRNFDVAINIWGADHHGYVPRLQSAMKMIGIDENRLKILLFQFVRLISDGEIVKMSKRTGKSVTLSDLLDEINVNCARFFFMMRQTGSHMDFDMDLAKREDNNNPVYYVQYAHARICGILRMMKLNGFDVPKFSEINPNLLIEPEEIDCLKKLCTLPNEIKSAAEQLDPSRITKYLMDLAALFHAFYAACRVKVDDRALCLTRIKLVDAVRIVMETLLDLLKIDAPERM